MQIYARIENNKVAELFTTDADIKQLFHPSLVWVDVTHVAGVEIGWNAVPGGAGWAFSAAPSRMQVKQLVAYANAKHNKILVGGTAVAVGSGLVVAAGTDTASLSLLTSAVRMAHSNAQAKFHWVDVSHNAVLLTSAQILMIDLSVNTFIQHCFAVLSQVITAIQSGKIINKAQVDSPPAPIPAWPVNN